MSTKKITALTELSAAPAATDMLPIVDVSDTTDAATGTTKKITATNVGKGIGIGAGSTTAEPVKIDTSSGKVGIGVASPSHKLQVDGTLGLEDTAGAVRCFLLAETDVGGGVAGLTLQTTAGEDIAFADGDTAGNGDINMYIDGSSGKVGIGTTSPDTMLELSANNNSDAENNSLRFADTDTSSGTDQPLGTIDFHGSDTTSYSAGVRASIQGLSRNASQDSGIDTTAFNFRWFTTATGLVDSSPTERVRLDENGNFLLGGTATPTSSVGNLCLFNGTIPAASVSNGVVLYAQDVSTSELKVRDEAGNITVLSPHNFDLIGERSEPMAWSYASKNAFTGKEVAVDMMRVIRALEKLTGEKYIKMRDIDDSEKLDWATEEKRKEAERKKEVDAYKARKAENDKKKADFDKKWGTLPTSSSTKAEIKSFLDENGISYEDATKDELFEKVPEKPVFSEVEPKPYKKKAKPSWIS